MGGGEIEHGPRALQEARTGRRSYWILLQGYLTATKFERDSVKKLTTLTSPNEILGYLIELDHN